jgi:hypothetical protein
MCTGGRYDGLLRKLWPPQATAIQASPAAVGMTINVKLLLPFMAPPAFQTLTPTSQVPEPNTPCYKQGGGWEEMGANLHERRADELLLPSSVGLSSFHQPWKGSFVSCWGH